MRKRLMKKQGRLNKISHIIDYYADAANGRGYFLNKKMMYKNQDNNFSVDKDFIDMTPDFNYDDLFGEDDGF